MADRIHCLEGIADPGFSLSPMKGYINNVMFTQANLGYASALAWITFAITMIITQIEK